MTGSRLSKNRSRSGASAFTSRSVGCRSRATGRRSVISGSVSRENFCTRASVSLDSSRKVGKIRIVSASASFLRGGRVERALGAGDQVLQLRLVLGERAEHHAGVLDQPLSPRPPGSRAPPRTSAPSRAKPGSVPSASLKSWPRPSMPLARSCCQPRNACARRRIQRVEDLVELDGVLHLAVGQLAALGDRLRCCAPASSRRRSRRAASSGAAPRARRCAAGRSGARSRSSRRCGWCRRRPRPCAPCRPARRPPARRPPARASSPRGS